MKQVSVVGNCDQAPEKTLKTAEELGKLLAKNKFVLVCGGRKGVMEKAAKGASEAGGLVVGILPGKDASDANPYVAIKICSTIGYARNTMVAASGDAVVVIGGGCGTLSEISYAWLYGKPIIAIKGTGGWADKVAGKKIDDKRNDKIYSAENAEKAVQILKKILV